MLKGAPITVIETPEFLETAGRIMDDAERTLLIYHLARHPRSGDLVAGAGGVRKLRWALEGRGKRGGARIIYYYHDDHVPLFALTAYAKNERANLTQADRNELRGLTKRLIAAFQRKPTR
jgi:hypothetical protein